MKLSIAILVNAEGEYVASHNADDLDQLYTNYIGGTHVGVKTLLVEVEIPDPKPMIISARVPAIPASDVSISVCEV